MPRPPLHRELGLRRFLGAWWRARWGRWRLAWFEWWQLRLGVFPPCRRCGRPWRPVAAETARDGGWSTEGPSVVFLSDDAPEFRPRVLRCRWCSADSRGVVLELPVEASWPPPCATP